METHGSRILILGGSGLVGMAIVRQLLPFRPAAMVICGLTREESEGAIAELRAEAEPQQVELVAEWGDIFVPQALKDRRRGEILADAEARALLVDDLYGNAGPDAVERSTLGALLLRHRPQIIIDCINTATVFAYQNAYASARELREEARAGALTLESAERHLATSFLPQLIRHVQLALEAMRRVETRIYVKIGTAGTGGMGLNVPFTHSEERPSRMLLAKASLAGAHTLLLYLMARTPGAPAVKEIKPTAAISWKRIGYGEIQRGRRSMPRVDAIRPVPLEGSFAPQLEREPAWREVGEPLQGVFLDAGENGFFSLPEFEALTALGLMEFITPEEIAQNVVREIRGYPTGRDVVAALDASTSGPTYRAGVLRQEAIHRMEELEREHGTQSVAFEMLGPPRLSKLLFEAAILGHLFEGDLSRVASLDAEDAACAADRLVEEDADLRSRILSTGLPILLSAGKEMLRGAEIHCSPEAGEHDAYDRLAESGWVDLRAANWDHWRRRAAEMLRTLETSPGADAGSRHDLQPWERTRRIRPGALAAWVFRYEDGGERIKR